MRPCSFLGNIRERLSIIASPEAGVTGGGIYDALLGPCASKAGAETIHTWNVKHFRPLGPNIAGRVVTP